MVNAAPFLTYHTCIIHVSPGHTHTDAVHPCQRHQLFAKVPQVNAVSGRPFSLSLQHVLPASTPSVSVRKYSSAPVPVSVSSKRVQRMLLMH
mmetsp:Transcript_56489/g.82906  ORF Transcript_56489/g.82906 Transcript_56489/m.82906 type:complete len:92 (-) Transcript_56489:107-382(-)